MEKFLDKPRHVETQCLADQHGNVVVVSTRDCSLQRRHQKLVEEAPAPFLTDDQVKRLYESSKAILREAGYVGAGTCEFLVAAGRHHLLPRGQHPPPGRAPASPRRSPGIDLVREMFRIAAGEELGYDDPEIRGHSIEFRINAEDGGRNFMPAPGTLSAWEPPQGPGVRVDGGYENGETVPGAFDSLIAKLIVTGRDRTQALERSRRALAEFVVDGMPTVDPVPRARSSTTRRTSGLDPPARAPSSVYTTWIETDFDNQIDAVRRRRPPRPRRPASARRSPSRSAVAASRSSCPPGSAGSSAGRRRRVRRRSPSAAAKKAGAAASGDAVTSPMQGTIVKVAVEEGQTVAEGDVIVVSRR